MRILIVLSVVAGIAGMTVGCQTKPTKVYESVDARLRDGQKAQITPGVVIVDARSSFDYSVSHINGAVNVRWDEFTQNTEAFRGLFEGDLFFHTRRLARYGIGPDTQVIVVGKGLQGGGEEGRVAWTLRYLGVKDVQFMSIESFERPRPSQEAPERAAVPLWKPNFDESLILSRKDFMAKAQIPRDQPLAPWVIDVRTANEYLGKSPQLFAQPLPDFGAINIPWTEFLTPQGIANLSVKEKLAAVGLLPDREIMVISNRGIESAMVTLVLRQLGYSKAANLAGGYAELLGAMSPPEQKAKSKRRN